MELEVRAKLYALATFAGVLFEILLTIPLLSLPTSRRYLPNRHLPHPNYFKLRSFPVFMRNQSDLY